MINHSEAYGKAVTADVRRTYIRAEIKIVSQALKYGNQEGDFAEGYARPEQLCDQEFIGSDDYATLELNRILLDGTMHLMPDDHADIVGQIGAVSDRLCDENGVFDPPWSVTQMISDVKVLQTATVYFAAGEINGYPADFSVDILGADGNVAHTEEFTDFYSNALVIDGGFTVENPTAIRVNVKRWSRPYYRARVVEIMPGIYELWGNDQFYALTMTQQANFTSLALPYGTCSIEIDNSGRRFEPENKDGIFRSIEERQTIHTSIGVRLPDGTVEYIPTGRYYMTPNGWTTGNNAATIRWELMDIVGVVTDREFAVPEILPTTLRGWLAAVMQMFGGNFVNEYVIAEGYEDMPVTANTADDVAGMTCGDIIRYACMACGLYAHADNATGKLIAEPMGKAGTHITVDNMSAYPTISANDEIGALTFVLADGVGTQIVVPGSSAAAANATTVSNPFIHTEAQARAAGAIIMQFYGGNAIEINERGNPASEVGDIDRIQLSKTTTVRGRRLSQTINYQNGVLSGCTATFIRVAETEAR